MYCIYFSYIFDHNENQLNRYRLTNILTAENSIFIIFFQKKKYHKYSYIHVVIFIKSRKKLGHCSSNCKCQESYRQWLTLKNVSNVNNESLHIDMCIQPCNIVCDLKIKYTHLLINLLFKWTKILLLII
jgi:hypothetical protein